MLEQCAEFIEKYKAKLGIKNALAVIHSYGISSKSVQFVPEFSLTPDNVIVSGCSCQLNYLRLHINISKVSMFYALNDYYFYLQHNDGERLCSVLEQGISSLLYDYFYGVYYGYNRDLASAGLLDVLRPASPPTISQLHSMLQNKYSNLDITFNLAEAQLPSSTLANQLDINSTLGGCYLYGEQKHTCQTLEVLVYMQNFNQALIANIVDEIQTNSTVLALKKVIPISLKFSVPDSSNYSSLTGLEQLMLSPEYEVRVE